MFDASRDFDGDGEERPEIEACDECNYLAREAGLPTIDDDDAASLPEAQAELRERLEGEEDGATPPGMPYYPAANPRENASGSWEVVSKSGGLEQIFADADTAEAYADELRRSGVRDAKAQRRARPARSFVKPAGNPARTRDEAFSEFRQLIRDPDPAIMQVAEDLALEHQLSLVQLSEVGNSGGVFVLSPLWPADAPLDRVEWEIEPIHPMTSYGMPSKKLYWGIGFRFCWKSVDDWLVLPRSGDARGRQFNTRDAAQRAGATIAWKLAKRMKELQAVDGNVATELVNQELMRTLSQADTTAPELYEQRSRYGGKTKQPTYLEARDEIMSALARAGWALSPASLRLPYATSPNGLLRLWFKPQAVHYTLLSRRDGPTHHAARDSHSVSYDLDIRKITPTEFIQQMRSQFPQGFS